MNSPNLGKLLITAMGLLWIAIFAIPALAQKAPPITLPNVKFLLDEVYRGHTKEQFRLKLESQGVQKINWVDETCKLTDSQLFKLRLANRSDVNQFFREIEELERFSDVATPDDIQRIFSLYDSLTSRSRDDVIPVEGTLLEKILVTDLNLDQKKLYEDAIEKDRKVRIRKSTESAAAAIGERVSLQKSQVAALVNLLETKPYPKALPRRHESFVGYIRFAMIDNAELSQMFEKEQVSAIEEFQKQYANLRGLNR